MKRLCCLLALLLLVSLPVSAAEPAESACGEELTWQLEDGTLSISGRGGMFWYDMGAAPWYPLRQEIRRLEVGEGVTSLCYCAFFYLTELQEVTLPASLLEIGSMAFYGCGALEALTIPAQVRSIGRYAFYGCLGLGALHVDSENTNYRDADGVLFENTQLLYYPPARPGAEYAIPAGTETVAECAFSYSGLQKVSVPAGVWLLDPTALADCAALRAVEVAWDNWFYCAEDGVLFNYDQSALLCYPPQKPDAAYVIPSGVTQVEIRAFAGCSSLQRVDVLGTLDALGSLAFEKCDGLRRVVFHSGAPGSVGFTPFPAETVVYYRTGKPGWENIDCSGWNAADVQPWTEGGGLLKNRGRLEK